MKDYILLVIGFGLATMGTLISFLLDSIKRKKDRKNAIEDRFYLSKETIYPKILSALRILKDKPDRFSYIYNDFDSKLSEWQEMAKDCDRNISQGMLFAQTDLREKLKEVGNSIHSNWNDLNKGGIIKGIEEEMKKELGIPNS